MENRVGSPRECPGFPEAPRSEHAEGRHAFLWSLFWVNQADDLLPAVQHVQNSLAEPRDLRCERIAASLGLPGLGRRALRKVLERFLRQMTCEVDVPDLPASAAYAAFDELEVFDRFTGGRDGTLWCYDSLAAEFVARGPAELAAELQHAVRETHALATG